jgi:hypothetical protein
MDKPSSLLATFVNYGRRKLYNIGPIASVYFKNKPHFPKEMEKVFKDLQFFFSFLKFTSAWDRTQDLDYFSFPLSLYSAKPHHLSTSKVLNLKNYSKPNKA